MHRIRIALIVDEGADRLKTALSALTANTTQAHELILLLDRPDPATGELIAELQLKTDAASGGAACFNKLIEEPADVYVLLESGIQVSPGWLEHLLAAFWNYPKCGLVGPSTNLAWNEQCLYPTARNTPEELRNIAIVARQRFGDTCRSLEPLYSLGDFCYVVRREVVDAIGKADERYGLGPCWEMDYNIRAARAGFQGLWACAAYVHRAPPTAREAGEEAQHFEDNKHAYQEKFCGLHLRGLKRDYRQHCRGDACPNFAPRGLIHIRHPWRSPAPVVVPASADAERPLVTCIMPTYNRRAFIPRALRCFFNQDYPALELVIVDDGPEPVSDMLPVDSRIRYFRLPHKQTVGDKRNFACAQARGSIIVHWDDDDWYAPWRVSRQVAPLLQGKGTVSGTSTLYYYNHEKDQAFRYQYSGPSIAWLGGLAYFKETWQRHPFESIAVGEDVKFISSVPDALRVDLKDLSLSVAAIHSGNVSHKITTGPFWVPESPEKMKAVLGAEARLAGPGAYAIAAEPMVSCIMPTHNRRRFIPLALSCYQRQTYVNRELIVVDDGSEPVGDLLEADPSVRYLRLHRRMSIGAKRNLAVESARGEFIAQWDDDDWYSPQRLAYQLEPLRAQTHDLTGLVNNYILQMPAGNFWTVSDALHQRMFVGDVHGGTLVYRRSIWQAGIRYPEVDLAEDAALIRWATQSHYRLLRLRNDGYFVYMRHHNNAWKFDSGHFLDPNGWSATTAPSGFSPELLNAYRAVCSG